MEDTAIINLYWNRDETAIAETDAKYGPYCHKVAFGILADEQDTEECVSDTWLRAWNAMPPARPSVLRAFLAKITRNLSIDRYKAVHAEKRGGGETAAAIDELEECISAPGGVEDSVLAKELSAGINKFLHALPERDCNVFLRRYFYAEPASAIAEKYGLTENNVQVILHRVRGKLKNYLEKEGLC